ncbi:MULTISPECIES: polyribonucleotide nucleotidyltransferase [Sphingobacterium]|jgi:polyribonucleotide nucleotidyltransferase|uniref:Polyribonucleotide nucleotidyltransferase n=4 Tax=Sphingobacterium TaxID=28453 RepID=A0ACD5C952_9SPHI|nr:MULTISPECIES: polyribonucleotide nucleotidyltransferase [Sphingobacterium]HAK31582.1 polyribonucleotide nucleotidyltransferase [Sphingobacterium sp.]APU95794.1 polyribonucleotide nucleotidyltransferase [Sphingobacterium sp. B29]QQT31399.1 polyribonucleotide nucleotidyltransferase [Sphingobacterium multivorum]QQT52669.1 polyribonucleotide nucleotidyltransferase [Sphingobacterium multivorum]QRY57780.1 polyribonucleotide nucleotidyltransferase [Sphingobacterium siyangense]
MNYNEIKTTIDMGNGTQIELSTGKLAKQADGAVVLKQGDTMLLATVVSAKEAKSGVDFLPLSVDYQEKYAATGRIPGGFLRREARLSDYEVLISRLVDRALRPLFPENYHADTQVAISLISADKDIMPDALAGLAASAAIAVSDIPFNGPISEVRVAKIDGQLVINPKLSELENATLEFIVAGSAQDIGMVEGEAKEISEAEMVEAIAFAHEAIKKQVAAQVELANLVGKTVKREYNHEPENLELRDAIFAATYDKVYAIAKSASAKHDRSENFAKIAEEYRATMPEELDDDTAFLFKKYFHDVQYDAVRNLVLDEGMRLDGRDVRTVRPIWSEVDYLPAAHGSAVFTRGETQSLTSVTLGAKDDEQMIDGAFINGYNKFILHYNFPAFSTGEVRPNRGPGRREVGHGNLAMRSLKQVLPADSENPYTIRVVSDILESNGSSSMATVCAGTLALLDAGVKLKAPVSGIAMGLISDEKTGKYAILSDILGDEDHLGDMDFKVTGTEKGIVACQMDLKINGLKWEVLTQALDQAKEARLHILGEMKKTISAPREDYKPHAPRIVQLLIDKEFIGAVIGPGGKIIQEMQRETGATISIEEVDNKGVVQVFADNKAAIDDAVGRIKAIASKPEIGETYEGKVKSIMPFGAFVEIMPGKDGLLHISEIDWKRLETMDGIFKEGDKVTVKLLDIDKQGKMKLSRKALLPRPPKEDKPKQDKPAGEAPVAGAGQE